MTAVAAKTLSVLLVEDSLADGRLLLEALRPAVYAGEILVQTVKRLSLAIEELQRFDFSCVLLDLGLPDGRGVENVSALRAIDHRPAIIVLTALDDEAVAAQALKLGAQDYVLKGQTDADHLLKLIRRAVQRNRQSLQVESQRDSGFIAATRDPTTLLPNLPLLLDRGRLQQAESRALKQPFGLGVLVIDGLDTLREQAGASYTDTRLHDMADLLSETLGPADTLARAAPQVFALLARPLRDATALDEKLARLVASLTQLSVGLPHTVTLQLRVAAAWMTTENQTVEQLLAEATQAAVAVVQSIENGTSAVAPSPEASMSSEADQWQPWLDVNTTRCAGAMLRVQASDESSHAALQAMVALRHQLAQGASTPLSETLMLCLPLDGLQAKSLALRLKAALDGHGITLREMALVIPATAIQAAQATISSLHSAGFQLVLECNGAGEPSFAELSQWPFQALMLPASQWQAVIEDNLRGPRRRGFSALLGAAQALGMRVIACDVDQPAARDSLRLIGVRWMQGSALMPTQAAASLAAGWSQTQVLPR